MEATRSDGPGEDIIILQISIIIFAIFILIIIVCSDNSIKDASLNFYTHSQADQMSIPGQQLSGACKLSSYLSLILSFVNLLYLCSV